MIRKGISRTLFAVSMLLFLLQPFLVLSTSSLPSFSGIERLTQSIALDRNPHLMQDTQGRIWAVWEAINRSSHVLYRVNTAGSWSPALTTPGTQLVWGPQNDTDPEIAQMRNGTIILAWGSDRGGNFDIYYKTFNGTAWGPELPLTNNPMPDGAPALLSAKDGSLWLVWHRQVDNNNPPNFELFYKVLRNGVWSPEAQLTTYPFADLNPSLGQMKDGTIWVVWARYFPASTQHEIFYKTYNGTSWSADVQLTNDPRIDLNPIIFQDRDGTIWILWSREIPLPANLFQDDLFYKTSIDNGVTWSADVPLTNTSAADDAEPSAIQASDHRIWLAWASTMFDDNWEIVLMKSDPISTHDVAVVSGAAGPTPVRTWENITVAAKVANLGDFQENLTVNYVANSTLVGSLNLALLPGAARFLVFTWNASILKPGIYQVNVVVQPVPGETIGNQADNRLSAGKVCVLVPGDINKDGQVSILDAALLAYSWMTRPGDPKWNPDADINRSGLVNISDAAILAANWKLKVC